MNNFRLITVTAMKVARETMADKTLTITDAAHRAQLARGTVAHARMILEFGTPEEIALVESGQFGLKRVRDMVRAHMTPEQRAELRSRIGVHTPTRSETTRAEAVLWRKFAPMLQNVNELPSPADLVKIVPRMARRDVTVNNYLDAAIKYLEDFKREWDAYQRSKASGSNPDT